MIDQILKAVLEGQDGGIQRYKKDLMAQALWTAKKYWKFLAIAFVLTAIVVVVAIWALWSLVSWAAGGIGASGGDMIQKVEEVGINWLIEQPLQLVRDIWYGKDGK